MDEPTPTGPRTSGRVRRLFAAAIAGGALLLAVQAAPAHADPVRQSSADYSARYIARYDASYIAPVNVRFSDAHCASVGGGRVVAVQIYSVSRVNMFGKTVQYLTAQQPTYVRGNTARLNVRLNRPITVKAVVWCQPPSWQSRITPRVETPVIVGESRSFRFPGITATI
jgi:hypothetical protein